MTEASNELQGLVNSNGIVSLDGEYHFAAMEGAHRAAKVKVLGHVGLQKVLPGALRRVGQLQRKSPHGGL
jgi:hypothetical protein